MKSLYKSIAPYEDDEVLEALLFLETNEEFIKGVQFFYPDWSPEIIIQKLRSCKSCSDFQVTFIEMIIKNSITESMNSFEIVGLDELTDPNYLYISNHRDIFLDSALLQNHLWDIGRPFTEISLGNNLMVNETMKAVANLNNMFTVIRDGSKKELLDNSILLSNYLRYSIVEKKSSSWIAQNNGRTKDGNDKTASGLIKMLLLSGNREAVKQSISELNIVVSTISFEYEPCAFEKAKELYIKETEGEYKKGKLENIQSIVNGIKDPKGNVKLVFEKLNTEAIHFENNIKKDAETIAKEIDKLVYKNYPLWKSNYIAFDILNESETYKNDYSESEKEAFITYLSSAENEVILQKLLAIYANPVINKQKKLM